MGIHVIIDKDELTPFERYAASMNYARSLLAWPPDVLTGRAKVYMAVEGKWQFIGHADITETPAYGKFTRGMSHTDHGYANDATVGEYYQMISRETDGSDPLVQEPGP